MGIATIPAPSSASAPFVGAGSIVANEVNNEGYFTTTLAAGNYLIYVNIGETSVGSATNDAFDDVSGWSYSAYEANSVSNTLPYGKAQLFKCTTSTTIYIGTSFVTLQRHSYPYKGYFIGAGDSLRFGCNVNFADPTKPMYSNNQDDNHVRTIALPAPTRINHHMNDINTQDRPSTTQVQASVGNQSFMYGYLNNRYYINYSGGTNSSGAFHHSTDTVTWAVTQPTGYSGITQDFAFGAHNSVRVAVSNSATSGANLVSSTDGISWTTRASIAAALYGVTAGGNIFVAVGEPPTGAGSAIITSTDGTTWSNRTSPFTNAGGVILNSVAYNNGIYLAMGNINDNTAGGSACTSTNGTTWTICSPVTTANAESSQVVSGRDFRTAVNIRLHTHQNLNHSRHKVFVGDGWFWLYYSGVIFSSTNGIKWNATSTGNTMGYGENGWVWYHPTHGLQAQIRNTNYAANMFMPTAQYTIYNHSTV